MKKLRVGVIYGGRSGEHEVSVTSAASIFKFIDRTRYEPVPIRIEKDGRWTLADRPPTALSAAEVIQQARVTQARPARAGRDSLFAPYPSSDTLITVERRSSPDGGTLADVERAVVTGLGLDVVFPVLHGPYGEDGTVQGLLELANVPYVGPGVLASAAGMDKAVMKVLFAAAGLPVVDSRSFVRAEWTRNRAGVLAGIAALGLPLFVKPANLDRVSARVRPQGHRRGRRRQCPRNRVRGAGQRRPGNLGARRNCPLARVLRLRSEVPR